MHLTVNNDFITFIQKLESLASSEMKGEGTNF